MKSAVLTTLLLCLMSATAHAQSIEPQRQFFLQAKVKHDFSSTTEIYGGSELDKTHSIEAELMRGEPAGTAMGVGIGYQFFREMGHRQEGEIAFLPVYFRAQATLVHAKNFSLYFGVRIGYNAVFLNGGYQDIYKPEGGRYFGVMLGCIVRNEILVEGSLTGLSGNLRRKDGDYNRDEDIGVPQLSLGVGFLFD